MAGVNRDAIFAGHAHFHRGLVDVRRGAAHRPYSVGVTPDKPLVVQTEHLDPESARWMGERCRVIAIAHDDPAFNDALAEAAGLVVRTYTTVNAALLARAPKLKVVGRAGVGLDNIDVPACSARGIEVVYTPDANTQAVVEYVLALIFDAHRPRISIDRALRPADWNRLRAETVGRRQINELTIGILGLGRVGRGVARVAKALGCRVIYNDLQTIAEAEQIGAVGVPVDELFATADVISIHIDGRSTNRSFVGERLLSRMKDDVTLINTSRGFVVDNLSLAAFVRHHAQALVLLDVHEPEPFASDYPLLALPNVRLYPHLASRTTTAMANMSWVVRDVWAVLDGRPPQFPAPQ